jgi:hypothetical protein
LESFFFSADLGLVVEPPPELVELLDALPLPMNLTSGVLGSPSVLIDATGMVPVTVSVPIYLVLDVFL